MTRQGLRIAAAMTALLATTPMASVAQTAQTAPPAQTTAATTLTAAERARLVAHLEQTRDNFLKAIDGVSPQQWTFKAAPERWSIAETAEHIIAAEGLLRGLQEQLMKEPAATTPRPDVAAQDDKILAFLADRTSKVKAPEPLVPKGTVASPADAREKFLATRGVTLKYAQETQDNLRAHVGGQPPFKDTDAYQLLLVISAHSARHTAQILEVKTASSYPTQE